jgi:hypothetical protein
MRHDVCPTCGGNRPSILFDLTASDSLSVNWDGQKKLTSRINVEARMVPPISKYKMVDCEIFELYF